MRRTSPLPLALLCSTLLLLSCVCLPVPDAGEVEEAFGGPETFSCSSSERPTLAPDGTAMSSARFVLSRSKSYSTDLVGDISPRLSATDTMQALSGISELLASRVTVPPDSQTFEWSGSAPERAPKRLSAREIKEFLRIFREDALSLATYTEHTAPGNVDRPSLAWVFKRYLAAYIDGDFVDRNGRKFSEPHIKDKVPNDVIAAPLAIFFEAYFDLKLNYPILVDEVGDKLIYYPAGNEIQPTAAKLRIDGSPVVPVVKLAPDDTACGITRREAKAIGFASNLAASRSTTLSGLVLENFGDVEVAFVVGGNFSVGDNETFATLVKTMFEVVSRRVSERALYNLFYVYRSPGEGDPSSERQRRIKAFLSDF
jgi:hypothetical protein